MIGLTGWKNTALKPVYSGTAEAWPIHGLGLRWWQCSGNLAEKRFLGYFYVVVRCKWEKVHNGLLTCLCLIAVGRNNSVEKSIILCLQRFFFPLWHLFSLFDRKFFLKIPFKFILAYFTFAKWWRMLVVIFLHLISILSSSLTIPASYSGKLHERHFLVAVLPVI